MISFRGRRGIETVNRIIGEIHCHHLANHDVNVVLDQTFRVGNEGRRIFHLQPQPNISKTPRQILLPIGIPTQKDLKML